MYLLCKHNAYGGRICFPGQSTLQGKRDKIRDFFSPVKNNNKFFVVN